MQPAKSKKQKKKKKRERRRAEALVLQLQDTTKLVVRMSGQRCQRILFFMINHLNFNEMKVLRVGSGHCNLRAIKQMKYKH